MRIALIGDVHANLPALKAVLDHAYRNGAQGIWNIGDFVGYGPYPEEVVCLLRAENAVSIQGNYDRKTLKVKKKIALWKKSKALEKWMAFEWAYERLSVGSRRYLRSLPIQRSFDCQGIHILLVHGSPASQDEHLTPDTPAGRFQELADMAGPGLVICGHSHVPFEHRVDKTWFINPGSVGRPDDGDARASYALLELGEGEPKLEHFRIAYDVEAVVQKIHAEGLPEDFAKMFEQGVDLSTVQARTENGK